MHRRKFIGGLTAVGAARGLSMPALAQPAGSRTLIFVPQANLTSLDPVWTTATVTRNFGYLVYDTLYGVDEKLQPQPQMAQGHRIDDDGKRWTITLRPGLKFHDDSQVRAVDCAASIRRWMKRDSLGQTVASRLDAMETPDDSTLVFRLNKPFASLAWALGKSQPSPPVIMPQRLAETDAFKSLSEVVGSGPFRFLPDQYVSGSRAVFAKFDGYLPRNETPSGTAGAKRPLVDRIEWRIIPEAATAAAALQAGEVDWVEQPLTDLLPQLRADRSLMVDRLDPFGLYPVLRFNSIQGPTANKGVRQAILAALNPIEVMQAVMGDDSSAYHAPIGCFLPGTESANDAAMDRLGGQRSRWPRSRRCWTTRNMTDRAGGAAAPDRPAVLRRYGAGDAGDLQADWRRRHGCGDGFRHRGAAPRQQGAVGQGGLVDVLLLLPSAGLCRPAGRAGPAWQWRQVAWYGWPTMPKVEAARDAWLDSSDPAERKKLTTQIQQAAFEEAPFVPLGQYFQSTAWNRRDHGPVARASSHLLEPAKSLS